MRQRFFKSLFKKLKKGFTLLIVPNASSKATKSLRIPFVPTLIILGLIAFNIYIFIGYTSQVFMINQFYYKINRENQIIALYRAERSRVKPVLDKDHALESQLTALQKANQDLSQTWKRVRQKGRLNSALITSRGGSSLKTPRYRLKSLPENGAVPSSLEKLDNNLVQIETIIQQETADTQNLLNELMAYERKLDHTPSIWPVYTSISRRFGGQIHPIYHTYKMHEGVDVRAAYGAKVHAAADGVVSFAGWDGNYGYLIKIKHDYGYETRYGHNSHLLVHVGQVVKKGQIISYAGSTGLSTGPHLHYEVRVNGTPVNPTRYMY